MVAGDADCNVGSRRFLLLLEQIGETSQRGTAPEVGGASCPELPRDRVVRVLHHLCPLQLSYHQPCGQRQCQPLSHPDRLVSIVFRQQISCTLGVFSDLLFSGSVAGSFFNIVDKFLHVP